MAGIGYSRSLGREIPLGDSYMAVGGVIGFMLVLTGVGTPLGFLIIVAVIALTGLLAFSPLTMSIASGVF